MVYRENKNNAPQNLKQDNIASNNRFSALGLNKVNCKDYTNEDENINVSNQGNHKLLKQQTTTIKIFKTTGCPFSRK